jgi:hypothetical protein
MRSFSRKCLQFLLLPAFAIVLFAACSKSDDTPAFTGRSKGDKMYNLSTGIAAEAGTFTFSELSNGNARLLIQLNQGYRISGAKFRTTVMAAQSTGAELLFADLGEMDGGSGTLDVNPFVSVATNVAVKYNDIIAKTGYTVKVMNGSSLQARGAIQ